MLWLRLVGATRRHTIVAPLVPDGGYRHCSEGVPPGGCVSPWRTVDASPRRACAPDAANSGSCSHRPRRPMPSLHPPAHPTCALRRRAECGVLTGACPGATHAGPSGGTECAGIPHGVRHQRGGKSSVCDTPPSHPSALRLLRVAPTHISRRRRGFRLIDGTRIAESRAASRQRSLIPISSPGRPRGA
jgi:hypothetical protein